MKKDGKDREGKDRRRVNILRDLDFSRKTTPSNNGKIRLFLEQNQEVDT